MSLILGNVRFAPTRDIRDWTVNPAPHLEEARPSGESGDLEIQCTGVPITVRAEVKEHELT